LGDSTAQARFDDVYQVVTSVTAALASSRYLRAMIRKPIITSFVLCAVALGCGDDDTDTAGDGGAGAAAQSGRGAAAGRAGGSGINAAAGRAAAAGRGGGNAAGHSGASGQMSDAAVASGDVDRGKYLVEHVLACGDCHTPHLSNGAFDLSQSLAGVDCFADTDPSSDDVGCLSSANLTNDDTGLKNQTDQQIKDMFLKGIGADDAMGRPTALEPVMPYYVLGNMRADDADAIVAFLRTVPAVNHRVKARQSPWGASDQPAPRFPEANIPMPAADYPELAAAVRGRYLAGETGTCLECHTGRDQMGAILIDKAFQGGDAFGRDSLGLPPSFPATIYSANLTPDETGLKSWTIQNIVDAIKLGKDETGAALCPPMPFGPSGAYGGLTDGDATDIAHYLQSLPAATNKIAMECMVPPSGPPPDADGGEDAG
jgi:hypothetical protein